MAASLTFFSTGSTRSLVSSGVFVLKLSVRQSPGEDETMVPVLTSRKASELPVHEVVCVLQVSDITTIYTHTHRVVIVGCLVDGVFCPDRRTPSWVLPRMR